MLRVWNVLLVVLAFALSLFGTFLTRSGILSSIHSFTESSIGPWFLGFICVTVFASLALVLRAPAAPARPHAAGVARVARGDLPLQQPAARRADADDPLGRRLSDPARGRDGESRIVGRGYYDFFLRVFGLPLLLLMGIGPLVAWRRASLRSLWMTFAWPVGAALAVGLILLALGAGSSIPGLIAYTFATFALATIVLEFVRGTRARRALSGGSWPRRVLRARRAQPPPLRRLRRPRRDRAPRDRDRRLQRVRHGARGKAGPRAGARGRRLPADLPCARGAGGRERDRDPGGARRRAGRQGARHGRGGQERLHGGAPGLERSRHPQRPCHGRGSVRDRGAGQTRRQRLLPRVREAARQPDLARRARLPARLGDHALARRTRAAAAGRALRRGRGAARP